MQELPALGSGADTACGAGGVCRVNESYTMLMGQRGVGQRLRGALVAGRAAWHISGEHGPVPVWWRVSWTAGRVLDALWGRP